MRRARVRQKPGRRLAVINASIRNAHEVAKQTPQQAKNQTERNAERMLPVLIAGFKFLVVG